MSAVKLATVLVTLQTVSVTATVILVETVAEMLTTSAQNVRFCNDSNHISNSVLYYVGIVQFTHLQLLCQYMVHCVLSHS